jgi:hypothetical protein
MKKTNEYFKVIKSRVAYFASHKVNSKLFTSRKDFEDTIHFEAQSKDLFAGLENLASDEALFAEAVDYFGYSFSSVSEYDDEWRENVIKDYLFDRSVHEVVDEYDDDKFAMNKHDFFAKFNWNRKIRTTPEKLRKAGWELVEEEWEKCLDTWVILTPVPNNEEEFNFRILGEPAYGYDLIYKELRNLESKFAEENNHE